MSVAVDPTASLRSWPLSVTVAGRDYQLQALTGMQWLEILLEDPIDLSLILPGLLSGDEEEELEDAMLEGRLTEGEIRDSCWEIVGAVAGRDWWWAMNLIQSVAAAWMVIWGRLVVSGAHLDTMPLGAILDAMYAICIERMDKQRKESFDRDLERPPAATELNEETEQADFLALMNAQ